MSQWHLIPRTETWENKEYEVALLKEESAVGIAGPIPGHELSEDCPCGPRLTVGEDGRSEYWHHSLTHVDSNDLCVVLKLDDGSLYEYALLEDS